MKQVERLTNIVDSIDTYSITLPVPTSVSPGLGTNIDPRYPRRMPIKPEIKVGFEPVTYNVTVKKGRTFMAIYVDADIVCTITTEDECGNEKTVTETTRVYDQVRGFVPGSEDTFTIFEYNYKR